LGEAEPPGTRSQAPAWERENEPGQEVVVHARVHNYSPRPPRSLR
jgi:hypothetical protein